MAIEIKFSIVIIARKINDYIRDAIPFIERQTYQSFEIIVVSESQEYERFAKTRIITSGRVNPAKARNIGAREACGEIIAFLDDDAYPANDWLEKTLRDFEDETIGAVGGPSCVPPNATFFQRVSNKVFELSSRKTGLRYAKGGKKCEIDDWPTCNFFVRKPVFEKTGGFDDRYWGGEDTRFCYALIQAGVKIIYDPEVIVYHHPRKTLKQHLRQTFFWGLWRGFMMKRYKQSIQWVFFAPPLVVLWFFGGALVSILWPAFRTLYGGSILVYLMYLIMLGIRSKSVTLSVPVALTMFLSHLSYGIGFIRGMASKEGPTQKTLNPADSLPRTNERQ